MSGTGIGSRIKRDWVKKQEGWVEGASWMNWEEQGQARQEGRGNKRLGEASRMG